MTVDNTADRKYSKFIDERVFFVLELSSAECDPFFDASLDSVSRSFQFRLFSIDDFFLINKIYVST